jgi:glycerol-3-phosphate acyltransferase PlsX
VDSWTQARVGPRPVRIAVDAMGGDHAPAAPVAGALEALDQDASVAVTLVGPADRLREELEHYGLSGIPEARLKLVEAPDWVGEEARPARRVHERPMTSVAVTARLVAEGRADAGISVGNTGAALAAAVLELGLLPGVRRPMAALRFPFAPRTLVTDVGPNAEVGAHHLVGFARLGAAYSRVVLGVANPRVGLLANGRESGKGTRAVREAASRLAESSLTFVGLVEPADVFDEAVDVAVCDGFVGNLLLKWTEALATWTRIWLAAARATLTESSTALTALDETLWMLGDATRLPEATQIVGVDGIFLPGHGRAEGADIARLIHRAAGAVRSDTHRRLREALAVGPPDALRVPDPR